MKEIVLTGLRANSRLHLGNYLGGILPVVDIQHRHAGEYQVNMFVPDLHSFTTPIDHTQLYGQTIDQLKTFVAAGLDIDNPDTYIYRQSYIPAHSELAWILGCFTGFGELSRMTQFKDKSAQASNENAALDVDEIHARISAGLFNYPVLMAADILLYGAKYVPVGDDQRQHLELARDLAGRMNNKFGTELFVLPDDWGKQLAFTQRGSGVRIRSLRNPNKKMSKSVSDPAGTIMLDDNPSEAAKKIMRAETDSLGVVQYNWADQPGITNLLQILALLTSSPQDDINAQWQGSSRYGDLKAAVARATESFLGDYQSKVQAIDEQRLVEKLTADEKQMSNIADATLLRVQRAVGLRPGV